MSHVVVPQIAVKQLGLAAFIKMQGLSIVKVLDRHFYFESDVPLEEWRVRYNNSCCMQHDTTVCELRHFLK